MSALLSIDSRPRQGPRSEAAARDSCGRARARRREVRGVQELLIAIWDVLGIAEEAYLRSLREAPVS